MHTDGSPQSGSVGGARKRRPRRSDTILSAAVSLFREKGYHDVGIDEIGAAAGITGPGVYRHFPTKQDVLAAVIWQAAERILSEADRIVSSGTPIERLEQLVAHLADVTLKHRELTAVFIRDQRYVSESDAARLRHMHLRYMDDWVEVLQDVRPELSDEDARIRVEGIVWMVRSVAFYQPRTATVNVSGQLRAMAMAALLADVSEADGAARRSRSR